MTGDGLPRGRLRAFAGLLQDYSQGEESDVADRYCFLKSRLCDGGEGMYLFRGVIVGHAERFLGCFVWSWCGSG